MSTFEDTTAEPALRRTTGWFLLVVLGVSSVISGDFAGWNFAIAGGGWGGLVIATALMAVMYFAITFSLAEMATAMPVAGGGYEFARKSLGEWGGFLTGTSILIEYVIAPAAIATFIASYVNSLTGYGGLGVQVACYVIFVAMHLAGAGEAMKVMVVVTAIAVVALIVFYVAMVPKFSGANLLDIPVTSAAGASSFLPFGYVGIWNALPFALWLFLAIEGVALAGEECTHPARDIPRGLVGAMALLCAFAVATVVLAPGGSGSSQLGSVKDPLLTALASPNAYGAPNGIYWFVNAAGLAGLIASFFAIIYGYSRLTFALGRAGYLPRTMARTNSRGAPVWALIVPGVVGLVLSLVVDGSQLMLVAVFGATISYALMMISHIVLRRTHPDLPRPFRTPGGVVTSGVGLILAVVVTIAGLVSSPSVIIPTIGVYVVAAGLFAISRRHAPANAAV